ncbi:MAG TPA: UbiA family prenyltransferase [Candidatus Sulfopaludibacter sp.]|nr:UbiA family prenyltransferase [Terriglobia bacterium]HEV2447231.1 UbiA family prenyltransferase [Candidatus Sulfopaludibacter sp.]
MRTLRLYWIFARPFTLIPPMVGIFSGALIGYGATRAPLRALPVILAVLAAAVLNAASNGLNQICDLENDRLNKPHRPLPSGRMSRAQAWGFVAVAYVAALAMAAGVNRQTFVIYLVAALATVAYSAPPLRLKRHPIGSNFTIALIRGELLKVAGWAAVSTVLGSIEPWYIGFVYFVFLLGATTTKDFADIEGDRAAGCITLPVRYGAAWSARAISPSFIAPWILLALGARLHILSGNTGAIMLLGAIMLAWGAYVIYLMNRDPQRLTSEGENHPSWRQMYWMMMVGHLGLAGAYLVGLLGR